MDDLRYPVGTFEAPALPLGETERARLIAEIAEAPARLRAAVRSLDDKRLERSYRPGGWTIRQVVHHVPDSHMNAYVRFRLALTEDEPTIKPYDEARWADLPDAATGAVDVSLALLEALHTRWVTLLRALKPGDWSRAYRHPEMGVVPLDKALALYAWHGRHHVAHVRSVSP
jgi:uncharacterized damage-inducible protein DinB